MSRCVFDRLSRFSKLSWKDSIKKEEIVFQGLGLNKKRKPGEHRHSLHSASCLLMECDQLPQTPATMPCPPLWIVLEDVSQTLSSFLN